MYHQINIFSIRVKFEKKNYSYGQKSVSYFKYYFDYRNKFKFTIITLMIGFII